MATRNIVPRADTEGGIGTAAKRWGLGWINALAVNSIKIVTGGGANKVLVSDADGDATWGLTVGTAASNLVQLDGSAKLPAVDGSQLTGVGAGLPLNHLSGLGLSNAVDTDHDIIIATGKCRDSTDAADLVLASILTKRADASWAVGDTNGGMDIGSIPTSGTLHVWLIKRSDTGVVDALFSISATSPTMPASYDYKRLIGSYRTDASANILNGNWVGTGVTRIFYFNEQILDYNNAGPGTGAVTVSLSTPGGIMTQAIITTNSSTQYIHYTSLDNNDETSYTAYGYPLPIGIRFKIKTNTASQIRFRENISAQTYITTIGWEQYL